MFTIQDDTKALTGVVVDWQLFHRHWPLHLNRLTHQHHIDTVTDKTFNGVIKICPRPILEEPFIVTQLLT